MPPVKQYVLSASKTETITGASADPSTQPFTVEHDLTLIGPNRADVIQGMLDWAVSRGYAPEQFHIEEKASPTCDAVPAHYYKVTGGKRICDHQGCPDYNKPLADQSARR